MFRVIIKFNDVTYVWYLHSGRGWAQWDYTESSARADDDDSMAHFGLRTLQILVCANWLGTRTRAPAHPASAKVLTCVWFCLATVAVVYKKANERRNLISLVCGSPFCLWHLLRYNGIEEVAVPSVPDGRPGKWLIFIALLYLVIR